MSQLPYIQQQHKECGGAIVAVAKQGFPAFACNRCAAIWTPSSPWALRAVSPDDWEPSPLATVTMTHDAAAGLPKGEGESK